MPLFEHAMLRPFRSDRQAVKLARKAHCKIANINHLLYFAFSFGQDFSRLERHEPPEIMLGLAQRIAKLTNEITAPRSGDGLPTAKCLLRAPNRLLILFGRRHA